MTPGERNAIGIEVGCALFDLQRRYRETTPVRAARMRALAIAQVAKQHSLGTGEVSARFDALGGDGTPSDARHRGRPIQYIDNRAGQADQLVILLRWAFKRLPVEMRLHNTPARTRAAIDRLACAVVPCDMGDLSRLRSCKRKPASARVASEKSALALSIEMLQTIEQHADTLALLDKEEHREVVTPKRLRAATSHLLDIARRLHLRNLRRASIFSK